MNEGYETVLKKVDMLEESGQVKMALSKLMHYLSDKAKRFMSELGRPYTNGKFATIMEQALEVLKGGIQDEESQVKVQKAKDWLVHVQQNFSQGVFDLALKYTRNVALLVDQLLDMAEEIKQRQTQLLIKEMFMQIAEPGKRLDRNIFDLAKNMSLLPKEYKIPTIQDEEAIKSKKKSSQRFAMVWIVEVTIVAIWSFLGFPNSTYNLVVGIIATSVVFVLSRIQGRDFWNNNVVMLSFKFKPKKRAIFLLIYLICISFFPLIEYKTGEYYFVPATTVYLNLGSLLDSSNADYFQYFEYINYMKWSYILVIVSIVCYILFAITFSKKDENENSPKLKKLKFFNWVILILNLSMLICIMVFGMRDLGVFIPLSNGGVNSFGDCEIIYYHVALYIILVLPVIAC